MRYRIFAPALRHTVEYRQLSRPAPNGRTLLEWLMTGDCTTIIPGLMCAGFRAVMEQLGWEEAPDEAQRAAWQEVLKSGLVRYDPDTRLIFLPFMVQDVYLPDQPNVLKSWAHPWAELPDCSLKHEAWRAFRAAFMARLPRRRDAKELGQADGPKTAFGPMFEECCPEPSCGRSAIEPPREPQNEGNSEPPHEPRNEPPREPAREPRHEHAGRGSPAGSPRGSLQDQDQYKNTGIITRASSYHALAIVFTRCRDVLKLDLVPCSPLVHKDIAGELRQPVDRYWLDVLKDYKPTIEQLELAGDFLAARAHWQDRQSRQGVTLSFLTKPGTTNFSDWMLNAEQWHAEGRPKYDGRRAAGDAGSGGAQRRRSGHVPSSAPPKGLVPTQDDLEKHLGNDS